MVKTVHLEDLGGVDGGDTGGVVVVAAVVVVVVVVDGAGAGDRLPAVDGDDGALVDDFLPLRRRPNRRSAAACNGPFAGSGRALRGFRIGGGDATAGGPEVSERELVAAAVASARIRRS